MTAARVMQVKIRRSNFHASGQKVIPENGTLCNWACTLQVRGHTLLCSEASRNSHHQKQGLHEWQRKLETAWAFQGSQGSE